MKGNEKDVAVRSEEGLDGPVRDSIWNVSASILTFRNDKPHHQFRRIRVSA